MCSIILRVGPDGVLIGANRDEMVTRPWAPPASHWSAQPGVIAGRDEIAGGTWLGLNAAGVMAAVLNRHGSLGPATGKRSRGELPLLALAHANATDAATAMGRLDAGAYRSFNLVIVNSQSAWLLKGLAAGMPEATQLGAGTWMITAGEPNDMAEPRIARHLSKFQAAAFQEWPALLGDATPPLGSALDIAPHGGFGTVCSSVLALPGAGLPSWRFAAGRPHKAAFVAIGTGR